MCILKWLQLRNIKVSSLNLCVISGIFDSEGFLSLLETQNRVESVYIGIEDDEGILCVRTMARFFNINFPMLRELNFKTTRQRMIIGHAEKDRNERDLLQLEQSCRRCIPALIRLKIPDPVLCAYILHFKAGGQLQRSRSALNSRLSRDQEKQTGEEPQRIEPIRELHLRYNCLSSATFADLLCAKGAQHVHELRLEFCQALRSEELALLPESFPSLRRLLIPSAVQLTDATLYALTRHCPQLCALDIRLCYLVTEAAAVALLDGCPQLRWLNVCACGMSPEFSKALKNRITSRGGTLVT